jgi:hypothetical protein
VTEAPRPTPLFIGMAAAATLVEGWLTIQLAGGSMSIGAAALVHAIVVGLLTAWTVRSPASRADLRLPLILTVMTAALGPLGSAGTLLAAVMTRRYARTAAPFEEWYASLFPDMAGAAAAVPLGNRSDARSSVAPFADILGFGTLGQKQELIGMIANEFRPAFAPTLRLALTDTNNAVRARDSRNTARTAYLDYLQLQPGDHLARAAVGRLLVQDGRYQDAADWLVDAIAAPEGRVHALLLWMEAQFNLGRFAEVRWAAVTHAAELIDRDDTPLLARETLKLWAGAV